jgi:CRISPR-associated endonuclease/helicase Cas3
MLTATSLAADDVADQWLDEKGQQRRVRAWDDDPQLDKKSKGMRLVHRIKFQTDADDGTGRSWLWFERPGKADNEDSKSAGEPVRWQVHTNDVTKNATHVGAALRLTSELRAAVALAAKFHDLGKKRDLWQRSIGNPNPKDCLAKSGGKMKPVRLTEYRHEFGSLLDILGEEEFRTLKDEPELQDLVLHLVAAHHGRARPHFGVDEAFDPESKDEDASNTAADVPRRFARLQRKYGRWGLAYLESLLRAADWAASANPSAFLEKEQEHRS